MKIRSIGLLLLLCVVQNVFAQCDQTLGTGDNIPSAVSSASNGTTICLESGNYGTLAFTNISRSGFVTLESETGLGASMSISEVYDSSYIRFQNLTFGSVTVRECSTEIEIIDSVFSANGGGLAFNYTTSCPAGPMNLLVDGSTFTSVGRAGFEGRISVRDVDGLTLSNNLINEQPSNPADASDGIMLIGGAENVTIGPGNIFRDIVQADCGSVHCDSIQFYGAGSGNKITGNYFINNTIHFGNYDGGSSNSEITQNIFDTGQSGQNLQIGGIQGMLMEHNTFLGVTLGVGTKSGDSPNSGWIVQNNIFDAAYFTASGDQPGCGGDCIMRYNLKSDGGSTTPTGTNNVTGTAVYVGTGSPSNWGGWELASGSPGENAGNDGDDMGVVFTPSSDTTPPTNVVISEPAAGQVSGSVTISSSCTDETSIRGVQFKYDTTNIGSEDTFSPYSVSWDSTAVANGDYDLTAVCTDNGSNSTTSSAVTVTVNNVSNTPGTVTITTNGGADFDTTTSPQTIAGTASDADGVASVAFATDRGQSGACTGTTSWSCSITMLQGFDVITITMTDDLAGTSEDSITATYYQPVTDNDEITITGPEYIYFSLASAGDYQLIGSVDAPSTSSNSFCVDVDNFPGSGEGNCPTAAWHIISLTTGFEDRVACWGAFDNCTTKTWTLDSGNHVVELNPRETGTDIESITFDLVAEPTTILYAPVYAP